VLIAWDEPLPTVQLVEFAETLVVCDFDRFVNPAYVSPGVRIKPCPFVLDLSDLQTLKELSNFRQSAHALSTSLRCRAKAQSEPARWRRLFRRPSFGDGMPQQVDLISHFSLLTLSRRWCNSRIARAVTAGRDYRHQTAGSVIVTNVDRRQI
jgi:hypothetical protein